MKKVFLVLFAAGMLSSTFVSCRETTTVNDDVEDVADDVADDMEDALD